MRQNARRQIMLDQPVQGTLVKRVTTYWFLCIVATLLMSRLWTSFTDPQMSTREWTNERFQPLVIPLLGTLLLLPLAWADMVRLSNRFVAPVHSIRTAIRRMLLGDDVPPLTSRPDDFWRDVTKQFNRLLSVTRLDVPDVRDLPDPAEVSELPDQSELVEADTDVNTDTHTEAKADAGAESSTDNVSEPSAVGSFG